MLDVVRTDQLAAAPDRFDLWQSLVARDFMPARIRSRHAHDFIASLRSASLGAVSITAMDHPSLEVARTATHVRQGDPECYFLTLNLAGRQRLDQNGNSALFGPGDLTIYHSSLPLRTYTDPSIRRESAILVTMPSAALPLRANRLRTILGTTMPGHEGVAAVVAAYLRALTNERVLDGTPDGPALAQITVDLVTVMLAQRTALTRQVTPETSQRALLARAQAFITARLNYENLTPETVAAAHHVSARTLQRVFRTQGTSVAAWIRQERLRRCHRDLADPMLAHAPVAAIGRRWGFGDPAHFNRAFKLAYGISPGAYRAGDLSAADQGDRDHGGQPPD